MFKKEVVRTNEFTWNRKNGFHFKTKEQWRSTGYLVLSVPVRKVKNEHGVTTVKISDNPASYKKVNGNFAANISFKAGALNTRIDGSTYQDISLQYGINQEGSSGFTITVGGSTPNGVVSGGFESNTSENSYHIAENGLLFSIESDFNGTEVYQFGEKNIETLDGNIKMIVRTRQFIETLKATK